MLFNRWNRAGLLTLAVAATACGGSGTVTMNIKSLSEATVFNVVTQKVESYQDVLAREQAQFRAFANGDYGEALVASSSTAGLSSFKMYFREIKLCEDLTVSGSGYTSSEGCEAIYENKSDAYGASYDDQVASGFTRTEATAAGTGKYFDVLDNAEGSTTGSKALTQNVSLPSGIYNYGLIEAHHWVKLTGTVTPMTTPVCTQSGGAEAYSTGGDGIKTYYTSVSDLTSCGTPGEAVVWLATANTTFKFLTPFEVNRGDEVALDLVFNLNNQVRGGTTGTTINSNLKTGSDNPGISVPMLRMVPVPRLAGTQTKGEIYTITPASSALWKLRVELYYNSADANKTILAALVTPIATTPGTSDIDTTSMSFYVYSAEQSGTQVTFKSWDGSTTLVFDRAGTTATISCPMHPNGTYMNAGCGAATVSGTYATPTTVTF